MYNVVLLLKINLTVVKIITGVYIFLVSEVSPEGTPLLHLTFNLLKRCFLKEHQKISVLKQHTQLPSILTGLRATNNKAKCVRLNLLAHR